MAFRQLSPPRIERGEKPRRRGGGGAREQCFGSGATGLQLPCMIDPQSLVSRADEDAVTRQRAAGDAVEQYGVALGESLRQPQQHRGRSVDPEQGQARQGAAPQPEKRRKISVPLVPPKPKELDMPASIFI